MEVANCQDVWRAISFKTVRALDATLRAMQFSHHPEIWRRFPELAAGTLFAGGIRPDVSVAAQIERFNAIAKSRLDAAGTESDLPEIKAWRAVFSRMGLKPTQYRCASESLLRRFRKEGTLPPIHPLIDLCNAASIAYAIPVAALDVAKIAWPLQVRPAGGDENYLSFGNEIEHPEPGEVTFADAQGQAHARRWTHRQSGLSAIRDDTASVLIVMEAVHANAGADAQALRDKLAAAMTEVWGGAPQRGFLTAAAPTFEFG
jgi:DNA/RNA-binding domain of Phe-tRNA-synthetase-like protein